MTMNENIDLTKILKDCPKSTRFYSTVFGEVSFIEVYPDDMFPIIIRYNKRYVTNLTAGGKLKIECDGECILFPSKDQRDWSKFTAPWYKKKFDLKALKPFDKVIYRNSVNHQWIAGLFSHFSGEEYYDVYICNGCICVYCVPYNDDTKHLVGTTDEAPEYYRYWED